MMRIRCCVAVGEGYAPKAKYALRMLLLPLGIDPVWITSGELRRGDVYYGPPDRSHGPRC